MKPEKTNVRFDLPEGIMTEAPHPCTLVTVFGQYPGNVIKGPAPAGQVLVEFKMPTCKVLGTVPLADVEERVKTVDFSAVSRQSVSANTDKDRQ